MNILNRHELEALAQASDGWCISMYLPTHRAGPEVQQNPIRLKNLVNKAETRLIDGGLRRPEAQNLLQPVRQLVVDDLFWQQQSDGLALFLSSDVFRYYRLPFDFDALVVVADYFHVKPLLPLLSGDGRFYILGLSQEEIRLLQGTRYSVSEVNLDRIPTSLAEVVRWDDPERRFQFHTATQTPAGGGAPPTVKGARPAIFHGHGVASADDPKSKIERYFHRVDQGLGEILADEEAPLVLAGVEYLLPLYREANTYAHLVEEGIEGNPEELSPRDLHERAWAILQPVFQEEQREAAARYLHLSGSDSDLASRVVEEILPAAHHGRVDTLFVTLGAQVWGTFDPGTNSVQVQQEAPPDGQDLLDQAAVHTWLNGGAVYAVEPDAMPGQSKAPLVAIFRY